MLHYKPIFAQRSRPSVGQESEQPPTSTRMPTCQCGTSSHTRIIHQLILKAETSMHLHFGTAHWPHRPAGETYQSSDRVDGQYLSFMLVPVQHMVYFSAAESPKPTFFPLFFGSNPASIFQYRFTLEPLTLFELYPLNLGLDGCGVNADKHGISSYRRQLTVRKSAHPIVLETLLFQLSLCC